MGMKAIVTNLGFLSWRNEQACRADSLNEHKRAREEACTADGALRSHVAMHTEICTKHRSSVYFQKVNTPV